MSDRILVIDDDAVSLELLCLLLEDQGYAVFSAGSGEDALALLHPGQAPPKVVLADCQLPGVSGANLAHALRHACGPSTLLLAMSGSQPPAGVIAEFDGFLLKPFRIEEVSGALASRTRALRTTHPAGTESVTDPVSDSAPTPITESASNSNMKFEALSPAGPADLAAVIAELPVLNENIFEKLACTMPVRQLVEMYEMCLNDARQRIAQMRACIGSRDSAQFVREAHAIKGSSGMLGATQLHGMAAELEKTGLETSGSHSQHDVNSLDELSAACDRLERMLGSRVQA